MKIISNFSETSQFSSLHIMNSQSFHLSRLNRSEISSKRLELFFGNRFLADFVIFLLFEYSHACLKYSWILIFLREEVGKLCKNDDERFSSKFHSVTHRMRLHISFCTYTFVIVQHDLNEEEKS